MRSVIADTPTELCWNVDFDLGLARRSPVTLDPRLAAVVEELSLHPWMGARPGDTLRAKRHFPDDFLGYLAGLGLERPSVVIEPDFTPSARLRPFGWNGSMADLNQRYRRPASHPALETVARVNGRRFARDLETKLGTTLPGGVVKDVTEVTEVLAGNEWPEPGWVLKPEHGHSGIGMRRLESPGLEDAARAQLGAAFRDGEDAMILEPWLERVLDLTLSFRLRPGGAIDGLELHETEISHQGSFIGLWLDDRAAWRPTWGERLGRLAPAIGAALAREEYHGPVGVDAFVARSPATPCGAGSEWLRPLSDLNARESMTGPVREFRRRYLPDRVVHWRFYSRRRMELPQTMEAWREGVGVDAFDPSTRTGALLTTPLASSRDESLTPSRKIGVLFAGMDRADVEERTARFRARFGRS